MDQVTVDVEKLIHQLEKNKENHKKLYEEALEGFTKDAEATFAKKLNEVRNGNLKNLWVTLQAPQDNTKEYEVAIGMLKMHTNRTTLLTRKQYQNYVMDDWSWTDQWLTANCKYSVSTSGAALAKGLL